VAFRLSRLARTLVKASLDGLVTGVCLYVVFFLRFEGRIGDQNEAILPHVTAGLIVCRLLALYAVSRYRLSWRAVSIRDVGRIVLGTTLGTLLFFTWLALDSGHRFPRSVVALEFLLTTQALISLRFATRWVWRRTVARRQRPETPGRRVLVVGAGSAGARIVREMREDWKAGLCPVAFVDDDPTKQDSVIEGVRVLGTTDDVPGIVLDHKIDQILIAVPSLSGSEVAGIVRKCSSTRAELTMLPSLSQFIERRPTVSQIRHVSLQDLLARDPVEVNLEEIAGYITGQRVLVTGGGGSIGSELCRQIASLNPERLIIVGHGENSLYWVDTELRDDYGLSAVPVIADVQDRKRVDDVFRQWRPAVVFHAAAHKHVPLMEANPGEAVKNNIFGTRNLAEAAIAHGVRKFVLISTDKAVRPTSVMGATKRVAEKTVQSFAQRIQAARRGEVVSQTWGFGNVPVEEASTEFIAVRFGNVLGSRGSVVPTMQRQIARGGPVTVTHPDMERYFMTIPEAVQLVVQAGAMGRGGEVFVLDMGRPVRILDLAYNLIRLSGFVPEVDIDIRITGVRPGEKLFEEVLTAEEGVTASRHEKIMVAKSGPVDHATLEQGLEILARAANDGDGATIRKTLAELVPSYQGYVAADAVPDASAILAPR
jgi:FlaA1/EpsC-like NDP-sugar epimerase